MAKRTSGARQQIPALKVNQWLDSWSQVAYDSAVGQAEPERHFYLCSVRAGDLKSLTGVYRRTTRGGRPRAKDPRGHEEDRSRLIRDFVQFGYPWCEMGDAKRKQAGAESLLKPGWLPTAIIVNILETALSANEIAMKHENLTPHTDAHGAGRWRCRFTRPSKNCPKRLRRSLV
jgi:hypothetical protein